MVKINNKINDCLKIFHIAAYINIEVKNIITI